VVLCSLIFRLEVMTLAPGIGNGTLHFDAKQLNMYLRDLESTVRVLYSTLADSRKMAHRFLLAMMRSSGPLAKR